MGVRGVWSTVLAMSNKTRVKVEARGRVKQTDKGGVYNRERRGYKDSSADWNKKRQRQTKGVCSNWDILGGRTSSSQSSLTSRQGVIRKTRQ